MLKNELLQLNEFVVPFVGYCVIPLQTIIFVVGFKRIESKIDFTSSQDIWLILEVFESLIDRNLNYWDNSCNEWIDNFILFKVSDKLALVSTSMGSAKW